jgi:hypothetical protein
LKPSAFKFEKFFPKIGLKERGEVGEGGRDKD